MGVLHEDRIQDRTGYAYKSSKRSAPERVRNLSCFRFPSEKDESRRYQQLTTEPPKSNTQSEPSCRKSDSVPVREELVGFSSATSLEYPPPIRS